MKIIQLKYFQAVCNYKNFTKASEMCYVSQPAISQAIKELENEFGLKLFHRYNNKLSLTKEGEVFLERCNFILNYIDETEVKMKDLALNYHLIKIGIPPMIGMLYFPFIFNEFKNKYPKVQLELFEAGSILIREAVERGDINLGVAIINEIPSEKFDSIKIISTELVFCVHKSHPLAKHQSISIKELDNEKVILLKPDSYQNALIKESFKAQNINLDVLLYTGQINTVVNILSYGKTGAFVFKEFVNLYPDLISIPLTTPIKIEIGIMWDKSQQLLSDSKKFVNFAKEVLTKHYSPQ